MGILIWWTAVDWGRARDIENILGDIENILGDIKIYLEVYK